VIAGTVTFDGAAYLSLAATSGIAIAVSGFAAGDTLDLAAFGFSGAESIAFVENPANTQGTLAITDGALKATVTLFGQYTAAGFHLAPDDAAGTAITYGTSASSAHTEIAAPHE
jgi:hypothetical protein